MSTAKSRKSSQEATKSSRFHFVKAETKVSRYDLVSALLVSSLIIVGFFATILGLIWITSTFNYDTQTGFVAVENIGADGDEKPEGFEDDAFDPGVEDFPEVETPQLAQALEAVSDAVSTVKANLSDRSGNATVSGAGAGYGSREGGPGGGGEGVPEYKRWKITYKAEDIDTYKRQLSFWKIDIGVLKRNSDDVYRVNDPAGPANVIPTNRTNEGTSLYFAHTKQRMMRWDEAIAVAAGVNTADSNLIQFYSNEARGRIREQEGKVLGADGKAVGDIRSTMIRLVATDEGFDFVVDKINYRN
jgi:hypothetical protein